MVLGSWFATRQLFTAPNVIVSKAERSKTIKTQNESRGHAHVAHRPTMRSLASYVESPEANEKK